MISALEGRERFDLIGLMRKHSPLVNFPTLFSKNARRAYGDASA
jgi:hypothetical protein